MSKTYLKIKIMSLAAEGKIIRHEEHKWPKRHPVREGLQAHRRFVVRPEARVAQLAYGFLRGRPYASLEAKTYQEPDWDRVAKLADRYRPAVVYRGVNMTRITVEEIRAWAKGGEALKRAA